MLISLTCAPACEDTKDRLILSLYQLSPVPTVLLAASPLSVPEPPLAAIRSYVLPFEHKLPDSNVLTILDGWHYSAHKSLGEAGLKFAEMVLASRGDTSCDISQSDDTDKIAEALLAEASSLGVIATKLKNWPEYIGVPRPRALLIGDRPSISEKYGKVTDLPFAPYTANSGEFLLTAMPEYVFDHIGIVNGTPLAGDRLASLWEALGHPRIIALGRYAEDAATKSGISPARYGVTLRHPQSVKRFANDEKYDYGRAIARCALDEGDGGAWALA